MILKKIKFNKGPAPYEAKGFRSGFVLLFAVVVSSIIFAIAFGVTSIALKEVKFSSSAQGANDAFFAADTGAECALYYDYNLGIEAPFSGSSEEGTPWSCAGNGIIVNSGTFVISGLGANSQSCAIVTVTKNPDVGVEIISKGYNTGGNTQDCSSSSSNRVERQLEVRY